MQQKVTVERFSSMADKRTAAALPQLYNIDVKAFDNPNDQYGLDLLRLALRQPDAFWVARSQNLLVAYLSVFFLNKDRLYNTLVKQAKEGTLDLPKLAADYYLDLAQGNLDSLDGLHVYIDAIAVRRDIVKKASDILKVMNALVSQAATDTSGIRWITMSTVITNSRMVSYIRYVHPKLEFVGDHWQDDNLFRQLYHRRNRRDSSGRFPTGVAKFLRFFSRTHPFVGWGPTGPTAGIQFDLK